MTIFEVFLYLFIPVTAVVVGWGAMLANRRVVNRYRESASSQRRKPVLPVVTSPEQIAAHRLGEEIQSRVQSTGENENHDTHSYRYVTTPEISELFD